MKLSTEQQRALNKLQPGKEYTAEELGCRILTLQSLQGMGLVTSSGWGKVQVYGNETNKVKWRLK